jgi:hypothetical protein
MAKREIMEQFISGNILNYVKLLISNVWMLFECISSILEPATSPQSRTSNSHF